MKRNRILLCLFLGFLVFLSHPTCTRDSSLDLIIRDGLILDGTGNPWYRADIVIIGRRVAALGDLSGRAAGRVLEAKGLVVCPGFIDIHTHCDRDITELPGADNYVSQGVTTVIGGNCGEHPYPVRTLFRRIRDRGLGLNFGVLIGHNTIRQKVMGYAMRPPTGEEMSRMKRLVEQEMRDGAVGLSTGLSYLPGIYSDTEEIVALAAVASRFKGIYATHLRDQGVKIRAAIEEAIRIGEEAQLPVQISHIKLAEETVWNKLELVVDPVEEARGRGFEVSLDLYPYTATSSGFTSSLPGWIFEGGYSQFLKRIEDSGVLRRVRDFVIERRLTSPRGINKLQAIFIARCAQFPHYEGKSLEAILVERGLPTTAEAAADLIIEIEKNGGASGIFFQMDEADVEALMRLPWVMIASDGSLQQAGKGLPHPRSYGTFSRVIGRYVRERGTLSLAEAVRKMTTYPAQVLRLSDRGTIREGAFADLVLFDPQAFTDTATFEAPHSFSRGLEAVLVNGQVVWEESCPTGRRPGMLLTGRGKKRS